MLFYEYLKNLKGTERKKKKHVDMLWENIWAFGLAC